MNVKYCELITLQMKRAYGASESIPKPSRTVSHCITQQVHKNFPEYVLTQMQRPGYKAAKLTWESQVGVTEKKIPNY